MTATQDEAAVGVALKAAILRARVARGAKPEITIGGKSGGLTWSVGAQGGKPSVGISWEGKI